MSNSRTTRITYTPRLTEMEAYDLLPRELRDVMKEGPQEWDMSWFYREWKKLKKKEGEAHATERMVIRAKRWTAEECQEGYPWRDRKPGQKWEDVAPSPHVAARATMQPAYGPYKSE